MHLCVSVVCAFVCECGVCVSVNKATDRVGHKAARCVLSHPTPHPTQPGELSSYHIEFTLQADDIKSHRVYIGFERLFTKSTTHGTTLGAGT